MRGYRNILLVFAIVIAAVAIAAFLGTEQSEAAKGVAWKYDFNAAVKEAAKTKKPIMIDFYADWCGWCKKLDKEVYSDPKVIEASRKFVSVKLDTDKYGETARKYGVKGLPTISFLKPDAEEISRIVGYRPAEAFLKEMNKAASAAKAKK